jgi:hypothetical protein
MSMQWVASTPRDEISLGQIMPEPILDVSTSFLAFCRILWYLELYT